MSAQDDNSAYLEQFKEEIRERLGSLSGLLLQLESTPTDRTLVISAFREAHTIKGLASVVGIAHVEVLSHRLEDIFVAARDGQYILEPQTFDVFFRTLDLLQSSLSSPLPDSIVTQSEERIASLLTGCVPGEDAAGATDGQATLFPNAASTSERREAPVNTPTGLLRITTQDVDQLTGITRALAISELDQHQALTDLARLREMVNLMRGDLEKLGAEWKEVFPDSSPPALIRARSQCEQLDAGFDHFLELAGYSVEQSSRHLELLQHTIRQIRFVPLAALFNAFPRMVRDLAQAEGKEVALKVIGGDTRVDREVLELLRAPLVQLLRNAVAHGIEAPEERSAAGKKRPGVVTIRAYSDGDRVRIEVADDGAGINRANVRDAATLRGIAPRGGAELTDEEATQLIFRSGFTTRPTASGVSGRGVGLDLVRSRLASIGGAIEVQSAPGDGTTFIIHVPPA